MLLLLGANDGSTQHAVGGTRRYCGDITDSPHPGAANDVDDARHHRGAGTFSKSVPAFEWLHTMTPHVTNPVQVLLYHSFRAASPMMTTMAQITISIRATRQLWGRVGSNNDDGPANAMLSSSRRQRQRRRYKGGA